MYERYLQILNLVYDLQSSIDGITYDEIQEQYGVSRRTAERMIKAISDSFLDIEAVERRPNRWRLKRILPTPKLNREQLAVMQTASRMFQEKGMSTYAQQSDNLIRLLKANMNSGALVRIEADADALSESEGFIFKPGPHENIQPAIVERLRYAVLACQTVSFEYQSRNQSKPRMITVQPYGFLHGSRQYLVAFNPDDSVNDFRTYILAKIHDLQLHEDNYFERQDDFSYDEFLGECFGAYHERPYNVVWRFNSELTDVVLEWNFHRSQQSRVLRDGRVEISFRAGGLDEMAWHLITWGNQVEVVRPKKLIDRLQAIKESMPLPL